MIALAASAGGDAPRPDTPSAQNVRELQTLSGNAQLLKLHAQSAALTSEIAIWKKTAEGVAKRMPAWDRLLELLGFAKGLPAAEACETSAESILVGRTLLAEPDALPDLVAQVTAALRSELATLQADLDAAFKQGHAALAESDLWQRLSDEQRTELTTTHQLTTPSTEAISTEAEIVAALRTRNLADRRNQVDAALPRFTRALADAAQLLEPKAQKLLLPPATVRTSEELEKWLSAVRYRAEALLVNGPVIL